MIKLKYLDSYKIERSLAFDNFDEFLLALSGCLTIPDNLKVVSLTYNGKEIPYDGVIGDLYRGMSGLDLAPYQD
ncbi:DUF4649 family protein [Streptococcus massiliensis]|uniref:30S ribosomal protein S16 n=1 Tax=Streptococcus massiliensis TaxID=313439 RepID=A0A380KZN7_9STRE|nr:DUF4649 family protein [Streptococcus massiliensis]SUN76000.1 30S ribosomal protein S16 [Streptococcus massiliensis]